MNMNPTKKLMPDSRCGHGLCFSKFLELEELLKKQQEEIKKLKEERDFFAKLLSETIRPKK